jgi:NtrC-family two-component system response regulator AlgB
VASVADLRERVRGWFHREPKAVVPRTILIVDANATNRTSTAGLVEQMGFHALQTSSAADALARLEQEDPECMLLGFELDDGDGLAALSQIREVDAEVPIIMLAADLWDSRVAEAMRRGAVAYLPKPFGPDDLRELLGRRR